MSGYVYILASQHKGTLYIGVTNDLARRIWEHKNDLMKGFTSKYKVHRLVWYKYYDRIEDAILHEKRIKSWQREWKIREIEEMNPLWKDLYEQLNE
ncbi:MAG TPA: endonuclease [Rhodospirillaceae bacterium]|nr:endonuclease [Rhodospirillaceae bacterium]